MGQTTNYGFNKWLESDKVNVDEISGNWNKLDEFSLCDSVKSVSKTASNSTTVNWKVRKFGLYYEEYAIISVPTALTTVSGAGYYALSNDVTVPLGEPLASIDNIQMTVSSEGISGSSSGLLIPLNRTPASEASNVVFNIGSTKAIAGTKYMHIVVRGHK